MEIHNISEDIVLNSVQTIFDSIIKGGNPGGLCLCEQCRNDTICYALNRIEPRYVVSNRGITRIELDWSKRQQIEADIASLVYKGIRLVNHNHRPTAFCDETELDDKKSLTPVFDIPTIIGRLFDGETFAPLTNGVVLLRCNGEVIQMRNRNWQNPYTLIENTPGTYTFWPALVPAEAADQNRIFEYSLKIESEKYETLRHHFKIPVVSSVPMQHLTDRTYKLPDLYLFTPGEAELNG